MLVVPPDSSIALSSSSETLVGVVHRLLDEHTAATETNQLHAALLQRNVVDCLSNDDALALFRLAIEHASVDFLAILLRLQIHNRKGRDDTNLTAAILRCIVDEGDATLLEAFLASGHVHFDGSCAQENDDTRSILHVAVEQDNTELVGVLLRHEGTVDVNERDPESGWTALHFAGEWDSVPMQALLLQAGADINAPAHDGVTPLLFAVQLGHVASATSLIESGADISVSDNSGSTPLHTAAREGHTALVDYLLHQGAELNARDTEGRTALHVAAFFDESAARFARGNSGSQVAVVRALLAHGADIYARDVHGNSALHTAQLGRFDVIVDLLLAHQRDHTAAPKS